MVGDLIGLQYMTFLWADFLSDKLESPYFEIIASNHNHLGYLKHK
jgi:hypothetical protein